MVSLLHDLIEELEARFQGIDILGDYPTVEKILAMYNDNGNKIESTYSEDNFDELFKELEIKYLDMEDPEVFLTVEEILKMYDDNWNKICEEVENEGKVAM